MAESEIRPEIADYLGQYVYALVDPRDGIPFYVGKGTRQRVLDHGLAARKWSEDDNQPVKNDEIAKMKKAKDAKINEIEADGHKLDIWIIRRGMSQGEYSGVEAAVIDLLLTFPIAPLPRRDGSRRKTLADGTELTNLVRGSNVDRGIQRLDDIVATISAPDLEARDPLLLITVNGWVDEEEKCPGGQMRSGHGFHPSWNDRLVLDREIDKLALSVCCWWTFKPENVVAKKIEHIVAVHQGVTRGLFRIVPGTAEKSDRRSGFQVEPVTSGDLFNRVVGEHGHRTPKKKRGAITPYRYWPYP